MDPVPGVDAGIVSAIKGTLAMSESLLYLTPVHRTISPHVAASTTDNVVLKVPLNNTLLSVISI